MKPATSAAVLITGLCIIGSPVPAQDRVLDLSTQKAETFWVFEDIRRKHGMPTRAIVEFQVVPCANAPDHAGFMTQLQARGFVATHHHGDPTVEVSVPILPMTPEAVWNVERTLTVLADQFGYCADGWGFTEYPESHAPDSV